MTESTHKQHHQSSRSFFHSSMLEDLKVNHSFPALLENVEPIQLALQERQDEILTAIARQRSKPSGALLEELAELSIARDDLPETNNDSFYLLHNHDQLGDIPEPKMVPAEGVA